MIHPGPYGIYETKDGSLALSMSPLPVLQEAMQLPDLAPLAGEPYNHPAREQIARILEPVLRTRTTAEWVEYLVPRGVWAAPVLDYEATFSDPAVREAAVVEEVEHPVAGRVRLLRSPLGFSSGEAAYRRHAPLPGEHTGEILEELGYSEDEVQRLRGQGVV
jgi:crotonobetainyl-CoA:carnitine CoA-transferase CaiB-like acyl-CoA transferase